MKSTLLTIYCLAIFGVLALNCSKSETAPAQQPEPARQAVETKAAPAQSDFRVEDSNYDHNVTVKEMAFLWKVDGESLKVKLTAKTTGWLGVGFNPEPAKLFKGVICIISILGCTIAPPALKLYAVEPVDVDIITPSR